jgi:hypothetical protein
MKLLIQCIAGLIAPVARQFHSLLDHPDLAQRQIQAKLLQNFCRSEYGRSLGIHTWDQIPVVTYDDLEGWIQRQRSQQTSLLTPDPVLFYERTSGSQGAAKWIPYTRNLRRSFHTMFCIWADDILRHGPVFQTGRSYISITPAFAAAECPEGLQQDSDYLDGWLQWLLSGFLVTVPGWHQSRNLYEFKHQLALALLREESLEILSIWSPTFLLTLLNHIHTHRQEFLPQLRSHLSQQRQQLLTQDHIHWAEVWPQLKLISCWDQAFAADPSAVLRRLFPTVMVQGKGLLATEGPITIPLILAQGCVPLVNEVFFEFEDETGSIMPLTQLQRGSVYSIIISQQGGFYRYRLGDRVRVTSWYRQTPCLELIGREHHTCDLVGEKLHDQFVNSQFTRIPHLGSQIRCLLPCLKPSPHYCFVVDHLNSGVEVESLAQQVDQYLHDSPHYALARQWGQLGAIKGRVIPQILDILTQERLRSGCRWGDIKIPSLWPHPLNELSDIPQDPSIGVPQRVIASRWD